MFWVFVTLVNCVIPEPSDRVPAVPKVLPTTSLRGEARLRPLAAAVPRAVPPTGVHIRLRLRLEYAQIWYVPQIYI